MTGVNRHGNLGRGIWTRGELTRVFTTALLAVQRWCGSVLPRTRHSLLLVPVLAIVLASCTSGQESLSAGATDSPSSGTAPTCGAEVTPVPEPDRQINLVLDESGSMFVDVQDQPSTVWSIAKYSLEAFAALIGPSDTLNVFPMSAYGPDTPAEPQLILSGSTSAGDRVQTVHDLVLRGRSTPWRSVTAAAENLLQSQAPEKWLVILTDGQFVDGTDPVPPETVVGLLDDLATQDVSIAFMSIGRGAVVLPSGEGRIVEQVDDAGQLLGTMTGFANTIFERSVATGLDAGGVWTTDIPMSEVVLFAQGTDVSIGEAETSSGRLAPEEAVAVSWTTNPNVQVRSQADPEVILDIEPRPDESLEGQLATFRSMPAGDITFEVSNASQVDAFYKPDVEFGYTLSSTDGIDVGNVLTAGQPYTLNYGFMDSSCVPVDSPLLNPITYTAEVMQDGQVVQADLSPGTTILLPAANYELRVSAAFTGGTAAATIPLIVTDASGIADFVVSEMAEFPPVQDGIPFPILVEEGGPGGLSRPLTQQEWADLDPKSVAFESTLDLEYELIKGQRPGDATILVRAPGGDVFSAGTGAGSVAITIPPQGDLKGTTSAPIRFTVIDDISGFDRLMHWFWTVGIWILLAILLLILLLGYLLKKRFPRRLKKRPTIEGIPRVIGQQRLNARGQFEVNGLRRLLPFVADTGTLKYVPAGTMGFRPMQVKAGPRKMLRLTNWKDIAKQSNVQVNGSPLDETTIKEPMFGASAMITADTPQMSFEMTPSQ
jgi:hypothetical protein